MCLATSCLVLEEYYQEYCRVNTGWTQGSSSTKEKKKEKEGKKLKKKETKPSNTNNNNNNHYDNNKEFYRLTLNITMDRRLFIERVDNRLKYDKSYQ